MNIRILLAGFAALCALTLVGCTSPHEGGLSRAAVEQETGRPGVPIILPVDVPKGYEVVSAGPESMLGDTVQSTAVTLIPVRREDTPVVEPVVEITFQPPAQLDAPGGDPCDVERRVQRLAACIRFLDTGAERHREFWRQVEFTTNLDRVQWLR